MNHGKKVALFSALFAAIFLVCGAPTAQGQAIHLVSYSCSSPQNGGQCNVTISWDDPNNPSSEDYLMEGSPQLGWFYVAGGNSGEYTAYSIESPVAFQLYNYQGNSLTTFWCYKESGEVQCG